MEIEIWISIIVATMIFIQLLIIFFAYKAENERNQKQSTIEFINTIRASYSPINVEISNRFSGVINVDEFDLELKSKIKELLAVIEHLSVGINSGVFNFQIFFRMSGSYFLNIFRKLHPFILDEQKENPAKYIEFEYICKKIEIEKRNLNRKITISDKGNIKFS